MLGILYPIASDIAALQIHLWNLSPIGTIEISFQNKSSDTLPPIERIPSSIRNILYIMKLFKEFDKEQQ